MSRYDPPAGTGTKKKKKTKTKNKNIMAAAKRELGRGGQGKAVRKLREASRSGKSKVARTSRKDYVSSLGLKKGRAKQKIRKIRKVLTRS